MNRRVLLSLIAAAALLVATIQIRARQSQGNNGESEIQRGFEIAPVPLNYQGKNRSLVGLGSYYVNSVSDCIGCHTGPSGYLSGGVSFGPVLSRNLTPDAEGRPAGLTFDQFQQVIHFGTDFKGLAPPGPLIVMPWLAYRYGTDRYVEALYEYLRSIPCIEGGPGQTPNRC